MNAPADKSLGIIEVGKPYAPLVGQYEGARFSYDSSGATIMVSFCRPTQYEIDQFASGKPLTIGLFYRDNILLLLFKFGKLQWIDAPYTPHLGSYVPLQPVPEGHGNQLTCLFADSPSGIIKQKIRVVGLDTQFTRKFAAILDEMMAQPFDRATYDSALNRIFQRYSTEDMVRNAATCCTIGSR